MKTITLSDEQIDEIVVDELKSYYLAVDGDPDTTWAIETILQDFMIPEEYGKWRRENGKV